VPSDSQVEYGATASYGEVTSPAAANRNCSPNRDVVYCPLFGRAVLERQHKFECRQL